MLWQRHRPRFRNVLNGWLREDGVANDTRFRLGEMTPGLFQMEAGRLDEIFIGEVFHHFRQGGDS